MIQFLDDCSVIAAGTCVLPIKFGPVGGVDPGTMGDERTLDDSGTIGDETAAGTTTGTMWD